MSVQYNLKNHNFILLNEVSRNMMLNDHLKTKQH
jgi:hypothetical protein